MREFFVATVMNKERDDMIAKMTHTAEQTIQSLSSVIATWPWSHGQPELRSSAARVTTRRPSSPAHQVPSPRASRSSASIPLGTSNTGPTRST